MHFAHGCLRDVQFLERMKNMDAQPTGRTLGRKEFYREIKMPEKRPERQKSLNHKREYINLLKHQNPLYVLSFKNKFRRNRSSHRR